MWLELRGEFRVLRFLRRRTSLVESVGVHSACSNRLRRATPRYHGMIAKLGFRAGLWHVMLDNDVQLSLNDEGLIVYARNTHNLPIWRR